MSVIYFFLINFMIYSLTDQFNKIRHISKDVHLTLKKCILDYIIYEIPIGNCVLCGLNLETDYFFQNDILFFKKYKFNIFLNFFNKIYIEKNKKKKYFCIICFYNLHNYPMPILHNNPMSISHNNPMSILHNDPMPILHNNPIPISHNNPMSISHNDPMPISHNNPMSISHNGNKNFNNLLVMKNCNLLQNYYKKNVNKTIENKLTVGKIDLKLEDCKKIFFDKIEILLLKALEKKKKSNYKKNILLKKNILYKIDIINEQLEIMKSNYEKSLVFDNKDDTEIFRNIFNALLKKKKELELNLINNITMK